MTDPNHDDGQDTMTLQKFIDACNVCAFTNDDGTGYFAVDGVKCSPTQYADPSAVRGTKVGDWPGITHVVWFNK